MLSDDEYSLLIGPFGALMTLQYGLPGAPASQPRNAVMGQAVAGAVSLAFTYIPERILATWLRRAVGPALGIASMVKLGFVHPPAGAHAVIYASGSYSFVFYGLVVLSTVISVIPATLVNNMSRKRQYPTYWGIPKWIQKLFDWEASSGRRMKTRASNRGLRLFLIICNRFLNNHFLMYFLKCFLQSLSLDYNSIDANKYGTKSNRNLRSLQT